MQNNYTADEVWKDIDGYEGLYQVSNFGNVKSIDRIVTRIKDGAELHLKGKVLLQQVDGSGRYWMVSLSKNGKLKTYKVHVLVAKTFLPNDDPNLIVMHKDEKNLKYDGVCNNHCDNLMWGTVAQNSASEVARLRNSLAQDKKGSKNPMYGKTQSEETRKKISAKLKGKGGRMSRSKSVVCDGVIFTCITDCADKYNIKACAMMSWLRGDRPMRRDFVEKGLSYV